MKRRHSSHVDIPCPGEVCDRTLKVIMSPGHPGTHWEPPEAPEMEEVTGCHEHEALIFEDSEEGRRLNDRLYDDALRLLAEADDAAYEREIDARRERTEDWNEAERDKEWDHGGEA